MAMATYGVATHPLNEMLEDQNLTHKGFADDGIVTGSLESLWIVPDKLYENGDAFRYNMIKCHLNTEAKFFRKANKFFWDEMVMFLKVKYFWVQLLVLIKTANIFFEKVNELLYNASEALQI